MHETYVRSTVLDPRQRLLITLAEALASCGAKPRAIDLLVTSLARHLKVPLSGIYLLPRQKRTMKIVFGEAPPASSENDPHRSSTLSNANPDPDAQDKTPHILTSPIRFGCNCSAHTIQCIALLDITKLRHVYNIYTAVYEDDIGIGEAQQALTRQLYDQWKFLSESNYRGRRHWRNLKQVVRRPVMLVNGLFRPKKS